VREHVSMTEEVPRLYNCVGLAPVGLLLPRPPPRQGGSATSRALAPEDGDTEDHDQEQPVQRGDPEQRREPGVEGGWRPRRTPQRGPSSSTSNIVIGGCRGFALDMDVDDSGERRIIHTIHGVFVLRGSNKAGF